MDDDDDDLDDLGMSQLHASSPAPFEDEDDGGAHEV